MRTSLLTRILSALLLVTLLFGEVSNGLAYALEADAADADTTVSAETAEDTQAAEEDTAADTGDTGSEDTDTGDSEATDSADEEAAADAAEDTAEDASDASAEEAAEADAEEAEAAEAGESDAERTDEALAEVEAEEQTAMAELEAILQSAMAEAASDADYDYATELKKFPASYQEKLKELHEEHPNWIFVAVDTGLDWDDVIAGELGESSTIDYTYSDLLLNNHSGYYDSSAYSSTNGYAPVDGDHVSCSRAAIAYYMDPRNFLTEKYIFQFEDLTYNSNVQVLSGVQTILKNACSKSTGLYHMTTYVTTSGSTATLASLGSSYGSNYSSIIYNVGLAIGISPYFLASKIAQETGADTTNNSISGSYSGYTGYYNFYNIGAYASTTGQAVANGLKYAKNKGWSNPILALYGGAEYIFNQYIGKGQNTLYYMRFNVSPDASYSLYNHQYMSATYAVASEATKTYSAYEDVGAVDSAFLFFIPVYDDMPDQDSTVKLTATTTGTTNVSCGLYTAPSTSSTKQVTVPSGASVTVLSGSVTTTEGYSSRLVHPYWYQVKVTVSGTSYTGYIDEENVDLAATYTMSGGSTKSLSSIRSTSGDTGTLYYETSDPDVATVSDSGVITAKGKGTCSIYVISGGGSFDAIGIKVSSSGSSSSVPSTPSITSVANANGSIRVAWGKVSGATGYTLWRRVGSTAAWTKIATISSGSTVSYYDTNVSNNTVYSYTVRATNSAGASGYDNTGTQIRYVTTPTLSGAKASGSSITVTWKKVTSATGYAVWRKTSGGSWSKLATISSGSTVSYADSTAKTGTTYYYTVRAYIGSVPSYYDTTGVSATITSSVPSAPSITSVANANGSIRVAWGKVSGATGYTLWRRVGSTAAWTKIATISSGSTVSYYDTNVSNNTVYSYTVRATNSAGASSYDNTGTKIRYVTTPTLSGAVASGSSITVTWKQVASATGYAVWRKTSGGSWSKLATISSGSTVSYTDSTAKAGTTYYYTVRAYIGSVPSYYNTTGVSAAISAPVLKAASNVYGAVRVTWTAQSGATKYAVYRKSGSSGWSRIGTTTSTAYDDKTASSGTKYTYTVRGLVSGSLSSYDSTGVSCLCLASPTLQSAASSSSGIKVSWGSVTGASGYRVYRKVSGGSWQLLGTVTTTSYSDSTGLTSGTTYYYTVRAVSGSTLSGYNSTGVSAKATVTTSSVTLVDYVTTGMLNYRSSPDKSSTSNIVGTLDTGTTVKIVSGWSQTTDGTTWYKMYLNGNYYYISSKYLKKA